MSATILNRDTIPRFAERLRAIPEQATPLWGRMRPLELMPHLRTNVQFAIEEVVPPDECTWLTRYLLRPLVFHVIPWPKGRIKGRDYMLPAPEGSLDDERERLIAAMERYVEAAAREPGRVTRNPVFGPMTLRYWGRVIGMHTEHHLRQFGV